MASTAKKLNERKSIELSIEQIHEYVTNKHTLEDDVEQVNVRAEYLEELMKKFNTVQSQLETSEPETHEEARKKIQELYYNTKAKIRRFQREQEIKTPATPNVLNVSTSSSQQSTMKIKLPKLNIPSFDGRYEKWKGFYDVFNTVIHENSEITNIEKFFYLKSVVEGEAAKVIDNIPASEENYQVALKLLMERYDNTNYITNAHIKAIFELQGESKHSVGALRTLISETKLHLRSLQALGQETKHWDLLIIHILMQKLEISTRRAWELQRKDDKLPTLEELYKFLEHRCSSLESIEADKASTTSTKPKVKATLVSTSKPFVVECPLCKNKHSLFQCEKFLKLDTERRIAAVREAKVCFNCLRKSHQANQCKSTSRCRKCGKSHNTLIHLNNNSTEKIAVQEHQTQRSTETGNKSQQSGEQEFTSQINVVHFSTTGTREVLLATVLVRVQDAYGQWHNARALLDSASQLNFATPSLMKTLKITPRATNLDLTGIKNMRTKVSEYMELNIASRLNNYKKTMNFQILEDITCILPHKQIIYDDWEVPTLLKLADPSFNEPGPIDLLLGAETFFETMNTGQIKLGSNLPIMQDTKFGWIFSGVISHVSNSQADTNNSNAALFVSFASEATLEKFWKLEEVPKSPVMTKEEKECEEFFQTTTRRDNTGRYVVKLPTKEEINQLGESYEFAKSRFHSLSKKLQNNESLDNRYKAFMKEYLDLNHMEAVYEESNQPVYYIPHHAVMKEASSTTKLRVVFDASMKTTSNISLNDVLKVGPTVHQDIFTIVIRFRLHKYAFTADIQKMYRQILVDSADTNLQRIIWTDKDNENAQVYRLKTVTYGTSCAPYLATKCLQQLAHDEGDAYPLAKPVLQTDFYVDDVMSGSNDLDTTIKIQQELINILDKGGFKLHKWCSNNLQVLQTIEPSLRETQLPLNVGKAAVKTLGLLWLPEQDNFKFILNVNIERDSLTKRAILSDIASIFDPLGLLSPVVVKAKQFIQELWKQKVEWDSLLDQTVINKWHQFRQELTLLNDFEIPRRMINSESDIKRYEIHGFCDASLTAYGACVYLKCINEHNQTSVELICAKSRITPLKRITIPRLELCSAVLLAHLQQKVITGLQINISCVYLWTDSTVVLHWLSGEASRWKLFVANRVSDIQEITTNCIWKHVRSSDNPADLLSRGLSAANLPASTLWWHGPSWLHEHPSKWPTYEAIIPEKEVVELKETNSTILPCLINNNSVLTLVEKCGTLKRLKRTFAYCLRAIVNMRSKLKTTGSLTTTELQESLHTLIKLVQHEHFENDLKALQANLPTKNEALKPLHPFIDKEGLLRVGGRLNYLDIEYNKKHPIILPKNHYLTVLILREEHLNLHHAGVQSVLANIRENYWPIHGRQTLKRIINSCIPCFKIKAKTSQQLMGSLPTYRTNTIKPFYNTGVDYGGPFLLKQTDRRNSPTVKAYIALFICLSTRAIHIEIVTSLSTEAFLSALKRFIARRGKCSCIHSDNATNFKGAYKELQNLQSLFEAEEFQEKVINKLTNEGIQWKFIPPNAPHFGGLWEAGIRSVKHHIKRVFGITPLTYEQFSTLLTQIESCVNSRPLCPISDDPNEISVLTPGHFLVGSTLTAIPEPNLCDLPENRLSKWQAIQQKVQSFWSHWSREYMHTLQQRNKWQHQQPNILTGAVVLLKEDNIPPTQWNLGRVVEVYPGPDDIVRVVQVRTSTGSYKRPLTKLCVLPVQDTKEHF